MSLLKGSALVLIFVMLFSCASTKEAESPVTEEQPVEETVKEKVLVEKEVEVNLYYPEKETSYYGNGQIDTIKTYTYDDNFNPVKIITSNEQGEPLETVVYKYENGKVVREESYDFNNQLNRYITYTYNGEGMVEEETLFDKEEKVQSINTYEYENGLLATWKTLGPSRGPMAITSYVYNDKGLLSAVEIKDAVGAIDGIIKKVYDRDKLVKEEVLDKSNKAEKSTEYIYDDSKLVEAVIYDAKGKKSRSESYIYAEDSDNLNPVNVKFHFKSGAVESYRDIEYGVRVVTKTILVEE